MNLYIDYALALPRTGEPERAHALLGEIRDHILALKSDGIVLGVSFEELSFYRSWLEAVDGNLQAALAALRQATQDDYACLGCLRKFPQKGSDPIIQPSRSPKSE
jgi:hypothetical protein